MIPDEAHQPSANLIRTAKAVAWVLIALAALSAVALGVRARSDLAIGTAVLGLVREAATVVILLALAALLQGVRDLIRQQQSIRERLDVLSNGIGS